ncbi:MAG TPA: hypothetical protein VJ873_08845, partial [bacterium]|nr:hypothetical protein [bacterium]
PDLLKVHKRLKPEWVEEWLKDPVALSDSNTRMPGFWPADAPAPDAKAFGGDGQKQREALRDYLFMLGKGQ